MRVEKSFSTFGSSFLLVSGGIFLSRFLGLARDIVFASRWGTGTAFASFVIAFMIPNLLRGLFGEGAFSAAFVPVFSGKMEELGLTGAWRSAQRIISVQALVLTAVVVCISSFSLLFRQFFAGEMIRLTLVLTASMMPYAVLICVSGALAGVLNALGAFAVSSLAPLLLNIVLITVTLVVCPFWGETPEQRIRGLALGVLLAGLLQLGAHLAACRFKKLELEFVPDWRAPGVRETALLIAPVMFGTAVRQINSLVDRLLAGWLGSSAVGSLYYSQRLVFLPVGLFGVAVATVMLPAISKSWAEKDKEGMLSSIRYALRHVLFLTLPVTAALALLGVPVIRLLFERGSFDAASSRQTAWALWFYLPGIPAFACAKVAVIPFHARKNTKTPVKIATVCLVLNLVLNLVLMRFLRQGGLALATTVSSYVNVSALLYIAGRDLEGLGLSALLPMLFKTGVSVAAALATACFVASKVPAGVSVPLLVQRALDVAAPLGAGALAFVGTAFLLKSRELRELSHSFSSCFRADGSSAG